MRTIPGGPKAQSEGGTPKASQAALRLKAAELTTQMLAAALVKQGYSSLGKKAGEAFAAAYGELHEAVLQSLAEDA